jgi:ribonuclease E
VAQSKTLVAPVSATPLAPAQAALPNAPRFVLPMAELAQIAQNAGLSWVHTDADKAAAVQAAIAAEPQPIHLPRQPKSPMPVTQGPLILVETKRDLRHMRLPFEALNEASNTA